MKEDSVIIVPSYLVKKAISSKFICVNCGKCIIKSELKLGITTPADGNDHIQWKHLHCVTIKEKLKMKLKDIISPEKLNGFNLLKSMKDSKVIAQWLNEITQCEDSLKVRTRPKRYIKNENTSIHESEQIITPKTKHSIENCHSNETNKITLKKHARVIELNK